MSVFIIQYETLLLTIVLPLKKIHYDKGPSDDENVKDMHLFLPFFFKWLSRSYSIFLYPHVCTHLVDSTMLRLRFCCMALKIRGKEMEV